MQTKFVYKAVLTVYGNSCFFYLKEWLQLSFLLGIILLKSVYIAFSRVFDICFSLVQYKNHRFRKAKEEIVYFRSSS